MILIEFDENSDATGESGFDVKAAWATEAKRRWQEIESGAVETISWEEVRAELLREE